MTAADRDLLRALSRAGSGLMIDDLARKTGRTQSAVRARIHRLADYITTERAHGYAFYTLNDAGRQAHRV